MRWLFDVLTTWENIWRMVSMWSGGGQTFDSSLLCVSIKEKSFVAYPGCANSPLLVNTEKWALRSAMTASLWDNKWRLCLILDTVSSGSFRLEPWKHRFQSQCVLAPTYFLLPLSRSCLWFLLLLCQEVLEELIHWPGNGSGGHLVYNPSLDPLEEGR